MNKRDFRSPIILRLLLLFFLLVTTTAAATPTWITDHETALKTAKEQGKPLVVDLWAEWCTPCKKLAKETFTDPQVTPLFDGFVLAKLDLTDFEDALWQTYQVSNLPVVAFFKADGTRLDEFDLIEFEEGAAFAARLKKVRAALGMSGDLEKTTEAEQPAALPEKTEKPSNQRDDGTTAREAAHKAYPSLASLPKEAQSSDQRIHVSLITDVAQATPGSTVNAAVHLSLHPKWHVYWKFPGIGKPTSVAWSGSKGTTFGETLWSVPHPFAEGAQFGYEKEQILLSRVTLPADAQNSIDIEAQVKWLVCIEGGACIPGRTTLSQTLTVGSSAVPSAQNALLSAPPWTWVHPASDRKGFDSTITLEPESIGSSPAKATVTLTSPPSLKTTFLKKENGANFIPLANQYLELDNIVVEGDGTQWKATFDVDGSDALDAELLSEPWKLGGVFTLRIDGEEFALELSRIIQPTVQKSEAQITAGEREEEVSGIWSLILLAFLGGLILNIMPCVLPILSIKALGLVQQAREGGARIWHHGLMYGLGVLISFWTLAAVVIALQSSGKSAAWGFQLQSPTFVIIMVAVLFAFALSLFGVFEITFGQQTAGKAVGKKGLSGSFFNGIFATMLGTPCTAPMLAPAAGFALAQPAPIVLVFFTAAGVGFAFPFVAIARFPAWSKWIPKPGPWMEHFKKSMAFLLIAAAIWLLDVLSPLTSVDSLIWVIVFLAVLSFACWLYGTFAGFMASPRQRWIISLVAISLVAGTGWSVFPVDPPPVLTYVSDADGDPTYEERGFTWKVFSPELMQRLRKEGKTVFVDFTTSGCVTCKVNKRTVVYTDEFKEALEKYGVVAVRGDFTTGDENIEKWFDHYRRAGVPLNVVLPPGAGPSEGILLKTLLTMNQVLEAFEKAASKGS